MAIKFSTFSGQTYERLKEAAKYNKSFLNLYKVVKKRKERAAKKEKVKLRPIIMQTFDDKRNIIHTMVVPRGAKFKITK
jgi:hypothetical protein